MTKIIQSKCKNYNILVDDEDYQKVMDFTPNGWEAKFTTGSNKPYAITRKTVIIDGVKRRKQFYLHRLIMNVLDKEYPHVDHKSNNGLDNRKENLRLTTRSQNMKNRTSKCKYLGVSYCSSKVGENKFRVNIQEPRIKKGNMHMGYYSDEDSAGYAYNCAAKLIHGEYGNLNNINMNNVNNENEINENILNRLSNYGFNLALWKN